MIIVHIALVIYTYCLYRIVYRFLQVCILPTSVAIALLIAATTYYHYFL
jgi:hypothetical protein